MDRLSKAYNDMMANMGIGISEAPQVMVMDNEKDKKTIESYVRGTFKSTPVSSVFDNHVDVLLSLINSAEGLDIQYFVSYDKKDGKSVYFRSKLEPETANLFYKGPPQIREMTAHIQGKDREDAMNILDKMIPLNFPNDALGELVSRENENLDRIYSNNGFYCINLMLHIEKGIHARPASDIVKYANELKSMGVIKEDNLLYMSEKTGKNGRADSIMSILVLPTGKGSVITLSSKNEEAVKLMYDHIKNMPNTY